MLSWFPIAVVFVVSDATVGVMVKINTILGPLASVTDKGGGERVASGWGKSCLIKCGLTTGRP
jgi:hypothetical protein